MPRGSGRGSRARRPGGLRARELAALGVDAYAVALGELALEQRHRELVDEVALDHPLERPGTVRRVVAQVPEQRARVVAEFDLDAALGHALAELSHLQVDDL